MRPIILMRDRLEKHRHEESEVVLGLELGGDDYVRKPFSVLELMAQIKTVLRRASPESRDAGVLRIGEAVVDFGEYAAEKAGRAIDLSPREFEILRYFSKRRGEAVSRSELLNAVWGYDSSSLSRTVDTHIAKLRQKIEADPRSPRHIITIHGIGYKLLV